MGKIRTPDQMLHAWEVAQIGKDCASVAMDEFSNFADCTKGILRNNAIDQAFKAYKDIVESGNWQDIDQVKEATIKSVKSFIRNQMQTDLAA